MSSSSMFALGGPAAGTPLTKVGTETYTASDAAEFSRRGACMTASPPDESESPYHESSKVNKLLASGAKPPLSTSSNDDQVTYIYTTVDAAEFVRRGASLVAWAPADDGKAE